MYVIAAALYMIAAGIFMLVFEKSKVTQFIYVSILMMILSIWCWILNGI